MPRKDSNSKRDADNQYVRSQSQNVRDIAEGYPDKGDMARRMACERDLARFCLTYFPRAFPLPFSADHHKAIGALERVILDGGLFALAMPRGNGKSTRTIRAAIWALLYGHRRFVCLVGATERHAKELLRSIKTELSFNDVLGADFRQVCYPIRCLENNGRRSVGQLFDGAQTQIDWSKERLTLPIMPAYALDGPDVGGSVVSAAGLTGAIRGQSHTLPDGTILRPEVAILDDPQTRESAKSLSQSEERAAIVRGDVLGMAGPGESVAAIMPCTVIRKGDLADEMLDRQKSPEWGGQLTKMLYSFPTNEQLWDQYREIVEEDQRADPPRGPGRANAFYAANRAAMDAGAVVAWPERHEKTELSALQHAMNLRIRLKDRAFFAEYQNDPIPEVELPVGVLTADEIAAKVNNHARGLVPVGCTRLTAFIDIHKDVLYYVVCGWDDDFGGAIVDYGTFPDQRIAYFTKRDARIKLADLHPSMGEEGRIYAGLEATTAKILGREYHRDDGIVMRADRCLIDANYGQFTELIYRFCRESAFASILTPSHGKGIGATGTPMTEWTAKPGDRKGLNWNLSVERSGKRAIRKITFDANFWKSFAHARLATAPGDRGGLSLFGDKPGPHRLFSEHLTAEYPVSAIRVGSSRTVDEWKPRGPGHDNHWLDCLVGSCVAASIEGATLPEAGGPAAKREQVSFREMQARARAKRKGA